MPWCNRPYMSWALSAGHTHFEWDCDIDGVRYIQKPLAYPKVRYTNDHLPPPNPCHVADESRARKRTWHMALSLSPFPSDSINVSKYLADDEISWDGLLVQWSQYQHRLGPRISWPGIILDARGMSRLMNTIWTAPDPSYACLRYPPRLLQERTYADVEPVVVYDTEAGVPPIRAVHWSEHYRNTMRNPSNVTPAPWVLERSLSRSSSLRTSSLSRSNSMRTASSRSSSTRSQMPLTRSRSTTDS